MKYEKELMMIADLDQCIHNPARLSIVYLLAQEGKLDYTALMQRTGLTSGNITTHLGKLEDCGYIAIRKAFKAKKPHTTIRLTEAGKTAYHKWSESILFALPEATIHKLGLNLLGSMMIHRHRNYPMWDNNIEYWQMYSSMPELIQGASYLPRMLAPNHY